MGSTGEKTALLKLLSCVQFLRLNVHELWCSRAKLVSGDLVLEIWTMFVARTRFPIRRLEKWEITPSREEQWLAGEIWLHHSNLSTTSSRCRHSERLDLEFLSCRLQSPMPYRTIIIIIQMNAETNQVDTQSTVMSHIHERLVLNCYLYLNKPSSNKCVRPEFVSFQSVESVPGYERTTIIPFLVAIWRKN